MDIPRPKFCVGEEVEVIDTNGALVYPKIEIIDTRFVTGGFTISEYEEYPPMWIYKLDNQQDQGWLEICLRKLPKDPNSSFRVLMNNYTKTIH